MFGNDGNTSENLIEENECQKKNFNDRMPVFLKNTEVKEHLFNKGWKFNMFNVKGQLQKQLSAVTVIFAMLQFALVGVATESSFAMLVCTYSLICLLSFLNISYVRDFDAIQVNFTPIVLSLVGLFTIANHGLQYSNTGMTAVLLADSYFGMRYSDDSDKI